MKALTDLNEREYEGLLKAGMLYDYYPNATGSYYDDCVKLKETKNE